jgi:hypothetical protein
MITEAIATSTFSGTWIIGAIALFQIFVFFTFHPQFFLQKELQNNLNKMLAKPAFYINPVIRPLHSL